MWRADSLEKTLMLGKIEGKRRRGRQRMRQWDSITDSADLSVNKLWETLEDRGAWRAAVHGVSKSQTWLSDWTAPPPTKSCWVSFKCIESGSVVWTCVYWGVCVCVCARCSFLPLGGDNDCMAADFFLKTVRVRGRGTFVNCWKNKKQKTHNRLHRILHTLKISCRDEEEIKTFSEEN